MVKWSCAPVVGRLLLACVVATANFCSADPADDSKSVTRTRLERIQSLRKERPNDGVLIFYEAITRIDLGDRDAAFALLRSLQGRKLGLVPVRDAGFEGSVERSRVPENSGKASERRAANAGCACRVSPRRSEADPGRYCVRSKTRPVLNWQRRAKENRKRESKRRGEGFLQTARTTWIACSGCLSTLRTSSCMQ